MEDWMSRFEQEKWLLANGGFELADTATPTGRQPSCVR
jgi:hypothetical protein